MFQNESTGVLLFHFLVKIGLLCLRGNYNVGTKWMKNSPPCCQSFKHRREMVLIFQTKRGSLLYSITLWQWWGILFTQPALELALEWTQIHIHRWEWLKKKWWNVQKQKGGWEKRLKVWWSNKAENASAAPAYVGSLHLKGQMFPRDSNSNSGFIHLYHSSPLEVVSRFLSLQKRFLFPAAVVVQPVSHFNERPW